MYVPGLTVKSEQYINVGYCKEIETKFKQTKTKLLKCSFHVGCASYWIMLT